MPCAACAAAIAYGSGFRPIGFEVSELPVLDLDTEGDPKGSAPKGPSILRVAIAYSLCTPLACNSLESVKTVKADMCMAYGGGNMPIKRAFLFAYLHRALHSVQMQKKETASRFFYEENIKHLFAWRIKIYLFAQRINICE